MTQALESQVKALKAELTEAGSQFDTRQRLDAAAARLEKVKRNAGLIVPDVRIAARALPLPRVAFPSPNLVIAFVWLVLIAAGIMLEMLIERYKTDSLDVG